MFEEAPQDVHVREGEPARFTCRVHGDPTPSVVWYFEGEPVHDDDIYQVQSDPDGTHVLFLPEAFPEDAGVYTVKASNAGGVQERNALLIVDGECVSPPLTYSFLLYWIYF